jgi:hypothetical protein
MSSTQIPRKRTLHGRPNIMQRARNVGCFRMYVHRRNIIFDMDIAREMSGIMGPEP